MQTPQSVARYKRDFRCRWSCEKRPKSCSLQSEQHSTPRHNSLPPEPRPISTPARPPSRSFNFSPRQLHRHHTTNSTAVEQVQLLFPCSRPSLAWPARYRYCSTNTTSSSWACDAGDDGVQHSEQLWGPGHQRADEHWSRDCGDRS
jgi:hypothetical protein